MGRGVSQTGVMTTNRTSNQASNRTGAYGLSPEVSEYRKSNHLCFRYGEKYVPGHQYKIRQLNCLVGEDKDSPTAVITSPQSQEKNPAMANIVIEGEIQKEVLEAICLSALAGNNSGVNSILVKGIIKNKTLTILVDFVSTHSFIDEQAVKETGYAPGYSSQMRVTFADGIYVMCNASCMGFS